MDAAKRIEAFDFDSGSKKMISIDNFSLNEYNSFEGCRSAIQRHITKSSTINVENIPDGTEIKNEVYLGYNSLTVCPTEMWPSEDLTMNADRMTIAGTQTWADTLGLKLKPFSQAEAAVVSRIIGDPPQRSGHINTLLDGADDTADPPSEDDDGGGGGGGGEGEGGEIPASAGAASSSTSINQGSAQSIRDSSEAAAATATAQRTTRSSARRNEDTPAGKAARAPTTPRNELNALAATSTARGAQAPAAAEAEVSLRNVNDVVRIDKLRNVIIARLRVVREDYPNCYATLTKDMPVASLARVHAYVLNDIRDALDRQDAILASLQAMARYEETHTKTDQGRELAEAIAPHTLDKTLDDFWATGALTGEVGTIEQVYGIPPTMSLLMGLARSYFNPREADASRELRKLAASIKFQEVAGELNVAANASSLSKAIGAVAAVKADCAWDVITRLIIAAVAPSCKATFAVGCEDGTELKWTPYAMGLVLELRKRGQDVPYGQADAVAIVTQLTRFARLRSREQAIISSAQGFSEHADPRAAAVYQLEERQMPDVLAARGPCSKTSQCGEACSPFPSSKVVCFTCGKQRPSWLCSACKLMSLVGSVKCARRAADGCPGLEAGGSPTPEAKKGELGGLIMSERRASRIHGFNPGAPGANGGGRGLGRYNPPQQQLALQRAPHGGHPPHGGAQHYQQYPQVHQAQLECAPAPWGAIWVPMNQPEQFYYGEGHQGN